MLRVRAPEPLPVELPQRRIYVLPTHVGLSFAALLGVMLLASLNYNLSLGFGLTFILAGVANLSLLVAHRTVLRVTLVAGRALPVYAGTPQRFELSFADASGRVRHGLFLASRGERGAEFDLPAHGTTTVLLQAPTQRRGRHIIGRMTLETRYPLGLIRAWAVLEPAISGLVYPAPETAPPAPPLAASGTGSGRTVHEGGSAFDSLRGYRPGDSARAIAWRTLARGGALATKVFAEEHGQSMYLSWFDCPPHFDPEARLARLCAWALNAESVGERYGLDLPDTRIEPSHGAGHLHRVLEALALYGGEDG